MIVTQIEIAPQTAGLATLVIKHVLLTTILMQKVSSEPLTLTGIYLARQSQTSCLTLRINYDSALNVAMQESLILSSMAESHRLRRLGLGVLTLGLISTIITAMSVFLQKAMQIARSLMHP
jgi:hypothetical protein